MPKNISSAYAEIQKQLSSIEGLRNTPEFPLENPSAFPYLEMGPVEGGWNPEAFKNQAVGKHIFPFKIHVKRDKGLPRAKEELLPFPERVHNLLMYDNKTLNGTVNAVESLTFKMQPSAVGGTGANAVQTLACAFRLTVQIYAGQG